ncbi:hypothetical protein PILCRDRAFT_824922 [Piloderma croceum F 1598]|uniref:Uncharacterized protein n=1 Tax=Piloderma croceum (strain F 1598) TaxID=765440 RepID=A0A0C3FDQ9_PILCF|nr:hypothetical protein PILCRDRAFT_824922 [Piloderma croceum F 1598]
MLVIHYPSPTVVQCELGQRVLGYIAQSSWRKLSFLAVKPAPHDSPRDILLTV